MGEILLEWARNIIFFMVFLSVISHLLADVSYEKYIRFFAGIVLILITVSPLKGGLDFQEKAGRFFEEFSFFQEKEQAGKALSKADQERMGAFLAEYKKEAEARIRETMQAEGVICSQAEVNRKRKKKRGIRKDQEDHFTFKRGKNDITTGRRNENGKRKSRGRSICKSGNSPCYNQRKAGKTRH